MNTKLDRIRADLRVKKVWDEGEDGLWVELKPGFREKFGQTHFLHEHDIRSLRYALGDVERCSCAECKEAAR